MCARDREREVSRIQGVGDHSHVPCDPGPNVTTVKQVRGRVGSSQRLLIPGHPDSC